MALPAAVPTGAFLTVKQVAVSLNVSDRTVRRLIRDGELVAHRIRTRLRVDAASVTALLEAHRVSSETHACRSNARATSGDGNGSADMSSAPTSFGGEGRRASGRGTSRARRSPSARPTESKLNNDSMPLPKNAAELKEALRRLNRPS